MPKSSRPNFLLFITDQHRADFLGCYGHPVLRTPNIDSIAARGTAFDRMHRGFENTEPAYPKQKESKPSYVVPARPQVKEHVPTENFTASDTSDLQAGQKVEHQKFGFGEVVRMEGAAHNPIATILFENNGEKKIMLNYAKLRII